MVSDSSLQIVIDYMQNVMGNQDLKYEDRLWVTLTHLQLHTHQNNTLPVQKKYITHATIPLFTYC